MKTQIIELTQLATPTRSHFGEFLVERHVLDRFQLFRALQMQDRVPGVRLGQCAVVLGYVPRAAIEQLHQQFARLDPEAELEMMSTDAFHREPEIEIVYPP